MKREGLRQADEFYKKMEQMNNYKSEYNLRVHFSTLRYKCAVLYIAMQNDKIMELLDRWANIFHIDCQLADSQQ